MAFQRERFVARLIELREKAGLTQEQAAHKIGVTYRQVQRWEAGESMPYPQNMGRIAEAFGKTISFFYDTEPTEPPATPSPGVATAADVARLRQEIADLRTEIIRLLEVRAPEVPQGKGAQAKPSRRPKQS